MRHCTYPHYPPSNYAPRKKNPIKFNETTTPHTGLSSIREKTHVLARDDENNETPEKCVGPPRAARHVANTIANPDGSRR